MVQIGVRGHDYGRDTPNGLFERIHSDGFSCVQLAIRKAIRGVEKFSDITPEVLDSINSARERSQMTIAVLGVYIEPSLADKRLRSVNVDEFVRSIPFAKQLDAVCMGTETTRMEKQPGVTRKEALRCLMDSLDKIMPAAEEKGITVAIEPVSTHTLATPELVTEMLKTIQSPNLKVIFDPANLFSKETMNSQRSLWDRCFQCFGSKIIAVHMKGVRLDETGGLIACDLSESILDYRYIFDQLNKIPQNYNVLREEVNPSNAKKDRLFLQNLLDA